MKSKTNISVSEHKIIGDGSKLYMVMNSFMKKTGYLLVKADSETDAYNFVKQAIGYPTNSDFVIVEISRKSLPVHIDFGGYQE